MDAHSKGKGSYSGVHHGMQIEKSPLRNEILKLLRLNQPVSSLDEQICRPYPIHPIGFDPSKQEWQQVLPGRPIEEFNMK